MLKPTTHYRYLKWFFISYVVFSGVIFFINRSDLFPKPWQCAAGGYSSDHYMAYCGTTQYGDYEHGAFWYGLETDIIKAARSADALFLGNSRTQFAFSTSAIKKGFEALHSQYYLFGFGFDAQSSLPLALMQRHNIHPKALIINADPFFSGYDTPYSKKLFSGDDDNNQWEYKSKRTVQALHQWVCNHDTPIISQLFCGNNETLFRARSDGSWDTQFFGQSQKLPVKESDDLVKTLAQATHIGHQFLTQITTPSECVIITTTPQSATPKAFAEQLATNLSLPFVYPTIEGLYTIDGSHLNPDSAERWSSAFMHLAEPLLAKCFDN